MFEFTSSNFECFINHCAMFEKFVVFLFRISILLFFGVYVFLFIFFTHPICYHFLFYFLYKFYSLPPLLRWYPCRMFPIKIIRFVPYATFWKNSFGLQSESGIVIKYLAQLEFIYYWHRPGNKDICQGACRFESIVKWKICCVWDNDQDFGNFEESLCQGMLFDTKTWTCYWKGVFAPIFWQ